MSERLAPGGTIGIFGGGQLGRLLALAAGRMGYRTHIYCPEAGCAASQVSTDHTAAAYDDEAALRAFAATIDVATCEFENVPAAALESVGRDVPIRPTARVLEIAQDRAKEKAFFAENGARTAPWRPVHGLDDLRAVLEEIGTPAILKTSRLGYDGKGQTLIEAADQAATAWEAVGGAGVTPETAAPYAVLEGFVDFACEISVIAARGLDGEVRCFEPVRNVHRDHILHTTTAPAGIPAKAAEAATGVATRAAEAGGVVGLLAVEMFLTADDAVIVNEMAPRPHNSGHWTLDGCYTDQFTQLARAVCGLPLGDPSRHSDAVMTNILSEDLGEVDGYLADPQNRVCMYGKTRSRPQQKLGHVTRLSPKT